MDIMDLIQSCSKKLSNIVSQESSERAELFEPLISSAVSRAVCNRISKPKSVVFVFHCPLPADCTKISYRDIRGDQSRSDYEEMIGFHANLACHTNPESLWLLITDSQFDPAIASRESLESRGQIAIARLPLNPYQLMFERVLCMYAYRLGEGSKFNTSFVDGDAFIVQNLAFIWRAPFNIYLTYRRHAGLMPVNEGVFHARGGDSGMEFSRDHLSQFEFLETLDSVQEFYGGNIRRWRGGQLSLNSLARIMLDADLPVSDYRHLCMLPCFYHNATPVTGDPFDLANKSVVHLKGNMKHMLNMLKRYFVIPLDST
jgi:hypothetical protein